MIVLCSSLILTILKFSSADDSDCNGFLLDSNCYNVIMQGDYVDYKSFSFSSSIAHSALQYDANSEYSWYEAKSTCEENGAKLATIPDVRVQSILAYYLKEEYPDALLFIGLRRNSKGDIWTWDGMGGRMQYSNWNTEPTVKRNACAGVYMDTNDSLWYDLRCSKSIWGFKRMRIGALCEISSNSNVSVTSAVPVKAPQCNGHVYIAIIGAQAILSIVLLITLAVYCKKGHRTSIKENETNGNSWSLRKTVNSGAPVSDEASNKYDNIPRNRTITTEEDEYEICGHAPTVGDRYNPTYNAIVTMNEDQYLEPMHQPVIHMQSVYTELQLSGGQ